MKRQIKIWMILAIMVITVSFTSLTANAISGPILEVGEVRSLGKEAIVPVVIHDTSYLTSGHIVVTMAANKGVSLKGFEPAGMFKNGTFRTESNVTGNKVTIDFIGDEQRIRRNESLTVGYITYTLTDQFAPGESVSLNIDNVVAIGRADTSVLFTPLHGKIDRQRPIGDITGDNRVDAADAMRILQHVNGNYLTAEEQLLAADIDGDGVITQEDAQQILDYTTGKKTTFLAVKAKELNNGVLQNNYSTKIEAQNGREPYTFKRRGRLPSGLTLDEETGEISGTPRRAGNFTFNIEVTDVVGNVDSRAFTIDIIDSNIIDVGQLEMINTKRGEKPALPAKVNVTYKDKTTGMEPVEWEAVDTSVLGKTTVKGTVGDSGYTIHAEVNVVHDDYIQDINVDFIKLLNLHTIRVDVHSDVAIVTINGTEAHYEGDNQFSFMSPNFSSGSAVTIRVFDKYGNILETKQHTLVEN